MPEQGTAQLEPVQRVAGRGGVDAQEQRPREPQPEPLGEQRVHVRRPERCEPHAQDAPFVPGVEPQRQRGGPVATPRQQGEQRLGGEPPQCERERPRGVRVEPLHVVDRERHRPLGAQRLQCAQRRDGDRPLVGPAAVGVRDQQRDLERSSLRFRQPLDRVERGAQQVAERRVGECALGLRRARFEHPQPVLTRGTNRELPERALADARLALDRERARPRGEQLEAFERHRHVLLSADQDGPHRALATLPASAALR